MEYRRKTTTVEKRTKYGLKIVSRLVIATLDEMMMLALLLLLIRCGEPRASFMGFTFLKNTKSRCGRYVII